MSADERTPSARAWLDRVRDRATDSALTAENVEARIRAVERVGQHGRLPSYWREPLFLAFTADDIAAQKLCAELDALEARAPGTGASSAATEAREAPGKRPAAEGTA